MFWCTLACDLTAFCCDILQNCTGGQVFHSVNVMRIRALTCGLLQHSKDWTQNPSTLAVNGGSTPAPGTNLRSANPINYAVLFPSFHFGPFLSLEGWCMLGVVTPATSCDVRIR